MAQLLRILFWFLYCIPIAQAQHDKHWFVATPWYDHPQFGVTMIRFEGDSLQATRLNKQLPDIDWTNAAWSDAEGNFRCFTNGCQIIDSAFDTMKNGAGINPGEVHEDFCDNNTAYPVTQGAVFLSLPEDSLLYLFHLLSVVDPEWSGRVDALMYSVINLNGNDGKGEVILKNQMLIMDTLAFGQLTAVKHANGTDWWLVAHENRSNAYYMVLLSAAGPVLSHRQVIGAITEERDWAGSAVFSPDGRFYARADGFNGIDIMEFNRCAGKMYDPRHLPARLPAGYFHGLAISPNSRFLYLSTLEYLEQMDLYASDIDASRDTIAQYDGFTAGFPTTLYMMQLAPNDKIYMTTGSGTDRLHVINRPDLRGQDCYFEQHAIQLPASYSFAPPNMPNFNLEAAPENYCDSLSVGIQDISTGLKMELFPNPAKLSVRVTFDSPEEGLLTLFNTVGQNILQIERTSVEIETRLDISQLNTGIYWVVFQAKNGSRTINKLVIQR